MIRASLFSALLAIPGFAPLALDPVKLEFKHLEGTSSTANSASKVHQILNIAGMDIETKVDNKVTVTSTVGKRSSDGRLPIQEKIESLAVELSLPGGVTVEFDSTNPNAKSDNPMIQALLDTYKARVGSTYSIVLGPDNKVITVEGTDSILKNASPSAAELLRGELNPEHIKKAAQQGYDMLPTGPVSKGDTWTRTTVTRIGGGQTLTFETKFEYAGTVDRDGKKLDKITSAATSVTYSMDPDAPTPLKVTQSDLKIDSSKATILFDREKGRSVQSTSVTRIVGDMTLNINGMDFPSKLDLTFDSTSILQK